MDILQNVLILLLACKVWCGPVSDSLNEITAGPEICQDKPADVVFILDSSASIGHIDFRKQLSFVQDVIGVFDMSTGMTRVASISFSNWAFLDFHLNQFTDKRRAHEAIGQIRQIRGDTNTAAALQYMQDEMFKDEHGGRDGIPHVAIILTDGRSNKPADTAVDALRARLKGIHIFAIGVGHDVDHNELRAIASQPYDKFVFTVDSFSSLVSIKGLLAIETCKVTDPPTTLPPITPAMLIHRACADGILTDIILGVPPTANTDNTNTALDFYQNWISGVSGVGDTVHIGMAPKDCPTPPTLDHGSFTDKTQVLSHIDLMLATKPSTANTIHYMRREGFKAVHGSRKDARKIGIIMIEDEETDFNKARREAAKAKFMKGMEIYVIAVGANISTTDMQDLATSSHHVYHVTSYNDLPEISTRLHQSICPVPST